MSNFDYCFMGVVFLTAFVVSYLLQFVAKKISERANLRKEGFRKALFEFLSHSLVFPVSILVICIMLRKLDFSDSLDAVRDDVSSCLMMIAVTYVAYQMVALVDYWLRKISAQTDKTLDDMIVPLVRKTLRAVIVSLGLISIIQQLIDKPVTSIIAGLGVGGLAVALAAQDTVKNFFGSIVLSTDQPFQLGDRIVVEGEDGMVEEVGMRSTRIRTLDGHLVTIPNGSLANVKIRNIGKRTHIKRVANISLTYDTSPEKVKLAIKIISDFLEANSEKMDAGFPSRVYFNNFKDSSLNIMIIYWFAPPDYWAFCDFDQNFNLEILERFNAEGIEFAFPTQTLYLDNSENKG